MGKVRVLLVDDDPYIRLFVPEIINNLGWDYVGEARDGQEGVEKFKLLRPDLVLLDQHMPLMAGDVALKHILEINPDAFVIMLSSDTSLNVVQELIQGGAKAYIVKSYSLEDMARLINKVWNDNCAHHSGK